MRFSYRAILTHRSRSVGGTEKNAQYALTYTITGVDDRGPDGDSTLTVTATGAQTFRQNWDPTAGAHSWVAGAGPANDADQVAAGPVTVDLSATPSEPPLSPKSLPLGDLFFLDLRQEEAIRTAFFEAHDGIGPRFVAPDDEPRGLWMIGLEGDDPTMEFYPDAVRRRRLELAYDPRGWLVEIRETLGDPSTPNTPNASFTLTLVRGP